MRVAEWIVLVEGWGWLTEGFFDAVQRQNAKRRPGNVYEKRQGPSSRHLPQGN